MENIRYKNAITETLEVMKGLKKEDINKIPKKLIEYFRENSSQDYKCDFDYHKPIKELNLQEETIAILDILCINYWCENELQRQNFIKKLTENEKEYQKELEEKFNIEGVFRNKEKEFQDEIYKKETTAVVTYKQSFFRKIISKIKSFFR